MMNKKYKIAAAGLAALMLIGGTLAYFSQTTEINNEFSTGSYEGTTIEKFNPGDGNDWQPGASVNKEAGAKNTGDSDLWVRIRLDETWKNAGKKFGSESKDFFPNVEKANQVDATDGLTAADTGSVVSKAINVITKEESEAGKTGWVEGGDGYFYWNVTLAAKTGVTSNLLESVTLCEDTDMGAYTTVVYYAVVSKDAGEPEFDKENINTDVWKTEKPSDEASKGMDVYSRTITSLNPNAKGYANDD